MALRDECFPLEKVTQQQLQRLSQELWSWAPCNECAGDQHCNKDWCLSQRMKRLTCFFKYYKKLTGSYEPKVHSNPALRGHNDFLSVIRQLKNSPDVPRTLLTKSIFPSRPGCVEPPLADQELAINLAVKVMTMINCSTSRQSWDLLEAGASQVPWRDEVSFNDFVTNAFPLTDHPSLDGNFEPPLDIKAFLMARKLKKRRGLKFRATDDIRRHLKLNRKHNNIELFHHTAFLKEHLRLTKEAPSNLSLEESLKR